MAISHPRGWSSPHLAGVPHVLDIHWAHNEPLSMMDYIRWFWIPGTGSPFSNDPDAPRIFDPIAWLWRAIYLIWSSLTEGVVLRGIVELGKNNGERVLSVINAHLCGMHLIQVLHVNISIAKRWQCMAHVASTPIFHHLMYIFLFNGLSLFI